MPVRDSPAASPLLSRTPLSITVGQDARRQQINVPEGDLCIYSTAQLPYAGGRAGGAFRVLNSVSAKATVVVVDVIKYAAEVG